VKLANKRLSKISANSRKALELFLMISIVL
jgi:hypothetical protein